MGSDDTTLIVMPIHLSFVECAKNTIASLMSHRSHAAMHTAKLVFKVRAFSFPFPVDIFAEDAWLGHNGQYLKRLMVYHALIKAD